MRIVLFCLFIYFLSGCSYIEYKEYGIIVDEIKQEYKEKYHLDPYFFLWVGMYELSERSVENYYINNKMRKGISDTSNHYISTKDIVEEKVFVDDLDVKQQEGLVKKIQILNYFLIEANQKPINVSKENKNISSTYYKLRGFGNRGSIYEMDFLMYELYSTTKRLKTVDGVVLQYLKVVKKDIDVYANSLDIYYYLTGACAYFGQEDEKTYTLNFKTFDKVELVVNFLEQCGCKNITIVNTFENNVLNIKIEFDKSQLFKRKVLSKITKLKKSGII